MELGLYSLDWETVGDAGTKRVFEALLEMHADSLGRGFVDAVTEEPNLPSRALAAFEELRALAGTQAPTRVPKDSIGSRLFPRLSDDPRLAVELDLRKPAHLDIVRAFALFSTGAALCLTGDEQPEIEVYDTGKELTFFGDEDFVAALAERARIPLDAVHRVD